MEASLPEKLARAVDARRGETVRLLQEFVRVPSITGGEGPFARTVEWAFRETGLSVETFEATPEEVAPYLEHVGEQARYEGRPNVIGRRSGRGGGRSILLNAHIDTVEAGDPATWTHDPFAGAVEGGRVYGRGSCDMKGGLVTHIAALRALADARVELAGDVTVAATVGEEDGGLGALATVLRGYRADAALITEPTRLALVPAQGGSLVFRLTVRGRAVHAAVRGRGVSALEKFVPVFEGLRALEREREASLSHPLYEGIEDKAPLSVGLVRSGNWASTVPESLVAEGRIGLIPGEHLRDVKALVAARVAEIAGGDSWLREHPPELEWIGGQFAPSEVPRILPSPDRSRGPREGHGPCARGRGRPVRGRHAPLRPVRGMPCVMYGAGDVGWRTAPTST
ncbi:ArgE/DapE family deacylase [Rubrobacter marinus]|uniref:Probable succinyl-diaminopimelate desuccinylase n=1 Tax=Rubrobacter marinus TaxID=2653852 RepID=A0A6G8PTU6_9ACTN|nr:ArgE/DapE family deacylase [Rubrobacter marinus]QIN77361.1 ArgE/DapE family deacylase [Rubrobacter marinus]